MRSDIFLLFSIIPIVILLLSGVFILALRGNKRPTNFMAFVRMITSGLLIINILQYYNTPVYGQALWNYMHSLTSLVAYPLLFAYMFSLMRPESINRKFWIISYAPLVILSIAFIACRLVNGAISPLINYEQVWANIDEPELWIRFSAAFIFLIQILFFAIITVRMQHHHRENLESEFSYTEGSTLGWIRWNIVLILMKGIASISIMAIEGQGVKVAAALLFIFEPVISTILVLRQRDLYKQPDEIKDQLAGICEELQKTTDNEMINLQPEKMEFLKRKLLKLLEDEEIFKETELSAERVCVILNTNRTYLSRLIKLEFNNNFYGLINHYRFEKAMALMNDPEFSKKYKLKHIAELSGYKSQSVFINDFKKNMGCTPGEWREKN